MAYSACYCAVGSLLERWMGSVTACAPIALHPPAALARTGALS